MKSKDFALIGGAVILGVIVSILVSKFVFVNSNKSQQVDVVPYISSSIPTPGNQYFNNKSIDPTQFIIIGNNSNQNPFTTTNN